MVSKNIFAFILCLSFNFFQSVSAQIPYVVSQIPNPKTNGGTGYVSNPDHLLNIQDVDQLNRTIASLESKTKIEIAVVMVRTFDASEEDFEFALELFNQWGIGKAKANNGLLLFIAADRKRYRFITGYGLEGLLPDVRLKRIGEHYLVPAFKEGKYAEGTINALTNVTEYLLRPEHEKELDQLLVKKTNLFADQFMNYIVIILLFWVSVYILKKQTPYAKESKGKVQNVYERIVAAGCLTLVLLCIVPLFFIAIFFGMSWAEEIRYQTYTYILYGLLALILFFRYVSGLAALRRVNYDDEVFIKEVRKFNRIALLYLISSPIILVVILLETIRRFNSASRFKPLLDQQHQEMRRVNRNANRSGKPFLNDGQIAEENLEVYHYDIWLSTDEKEDKIVSYPAINYNRYTQCLKCNFRAFSAKRVVTVLKPTYKKPGENKQIRTCENCGYEELLNTFVVPVKRRQSRSSDFSSSGDGSSSSSSSSSSGSSWGGGSSGGGGAGGSW